MYNIITNTGFKKNKWAGLKTSSLPLLQHQKCQTKNTEDLYDWLDRWTSVFFRILISDSKSSVNWNIP